MLEAENIGQEQVHLPLGGFIQISPPTKKTK
jgi:hypothetical protein